MVMMMRRRIAKTLFIQHTQIFLCIWPNINTSSLGTSFIIRFSSKASFIYVTCEECRSYPNPFASMPSFHFEWNREGAQVMETFFPLHRASSWMVLFFSSVVQHCLAVAATWFFNRGSELSFFTVPLFTRPRCRSSDSFDLGEQLKQKT